MRIAVEELLRDDASGLLATMRDHEAALKQASHDRPFGQPSDVHQAAGSYGIWARDAADRLARVPLDEGRVRDLLRRLAAEAAGRELDIEAARLTARAAWAFHADLGEDSKSEREVVAALRDLSRDLGLGLPDRPGPTAHARPNRPGRRATRARLRRLPPARRGAEGAVRV